MESREATASCESIIAMQTPPKRTAPQDGGRAAIPGASPQPRLLWLDVIKGFSIF
jgi:hypothetical protein